MINDIGNKIILVLFIGAIIGINNMFLRRIDKKLNSLISIDSVSNNIYSDYKEIEINETDCNEIKIGDSVETNEQFGDKVYGIVLEFIYRGEAYPIAILDNKKAISVFWLLWPRP